MDGLSIKNGATIQPTGACRLKLFIFFPDIPQHSTYKKRRFPKGQNFLKEVFK